MNEKIERIHELLDELASVAKEVFPDYSRISTNCANDGYRTFEILKWDFDNGEPVETAPRCVLFAQTKVSEKYDWGDDRSHVQNEYYDKIGVLLKD